MGMSHFERLEKIAQEEFGDLDLSEQYRFHGDKVQWNHHVQANLVSLINDVLMASPRWMGRGGKAGFTAHALFLAARVEIAMLNAPSNELLNIVEQALSEVRTARALDRVKKDEQMLQDLERNWQDMTLEILPGLLETARNIMNGGVTNGHRVRARRLVDDMEARLS